MTGWAYTYLAIGMVGWTLGSYLVGRKDAGDRLIHPAAVPVAYTWGIGWYLLAFAEIAANTSPIT